MQLSELINAQPKGCVLRLQVTDDNVTLSMIRGNEQSSVKLARADITANEYLVPAYMQSMVDTFSRPVIPCAPRQDQPAP